jgi:thioredoxin 1
MVIELTSENFEKEVIKAEGPVIVDFWAPWCGPCRMMAPVFEKLSSEYSGKLKFAKLNVEENTSFAAQFGIQGIPALSVFEGKEEKTRIVGFNDEDTLRNKINGILE